MGLLDALEESVVVGVEVTINEVGGGSGNLFIGMVLEDLLAVCAAFQKM